MISGIKKKRLFVSVSTLNFVVFDSFLLEKKEKGVHITGKNCFKLKFKMQILI